MRWSRLFPLGIAVVVAACASAGGGPAELFAPYLEGTLEPHRTEVMASVERVSAVLPEAYELMGLPVSLDEDLGENTWVTPELQIDGPLYQGEQNSDYIDCGMSDEGPRADVYSVEFAVLTRLIPGPSATTVETVLSGVAADPAGPVTCTGTGKLERDIARVLRLRAPR
jgi:hypothetical protein